tara:strand:- start:5869 stop:6369 length:501 start_codon:yes stop_codon:yes gene_type:complete
MTTSRLRPTVAGLVVKPENPYPLIGIHWPKKAAQCGEGNLSTAGGGIHSDETPEAAMLRELREEYRITGAEVTMMGHPRWEFGGKLYTWCLVKCLTGPDPRVNRAEVASFGWYSAPEQLRVAVQAMHDNKRYMFIRALSIAAQLEPELFVRYKRAIKQRKQVSEFV